MDKNEMKINEKFNNINKRIDEMMEYVKKINDENKEKLSTPDIQNMITKNFSDIGKIFDQQQQSFQSKVDELTKRFSEFLNKEKKYQKRSDSDSIKNEDGSKNSQPDDKKIQKKTKYDDVLNELKNRFEYISERKKYLENSLNDDEEQLDKLERFIHNQRMELQDIISEQSDIQKKIADINRRKDLSRTNSKNGGKHIKVCLTPDESDFFRHIFRL